MAGLHGGEGARIEVPLLDSGLAGTVNVAQNALVTGAEPARYGNAHPNIVPYETFETASGQIAMAAANDGLFRALCRALGLDELAADERFATNAGRVEHRGELIPLLAGRLRERPAEDWLRELDAAGRAGGQGANGAGGAGRRGGRRAAGDGDGGAPERGAARPGGLADLGPYTRRPDTAAAAG